MGDALIEVRDVHRSYRRPRTSLRHPAPPVHALRGVSFDIAEGQRFGLVGESGSGKSTLIRLLAGLDSPTSGTITFGGRAPPCGTPRPRCRRCAGCRSTSPPDSGSGWSASRGRASRR